MSSTVTLDYEQVPTRSSSKEYELVSTTESAPSLGSKSGGRRDTNSKECLESPRKQTSTCRGWVHRKFGQITLGLLGLIALLLAGIVLLKTFYRPSFENTEYLPLQTEEFVTTFTSCGPVEGRNDAGVISFKAIPYAQPPIGEKRWKFAETLNSVSSCWNGTYSAHNSSKTCWQRLLNGTRFGTEDCLYLDIYTPRVGYDSPLPVVVVLTSEDFDSDSLTVNPKIALERNVVLVKVQFRLGVFGFLRAVELAKRVYPHTSGNYGMSDIVTALLWVKHNIEHFGGEPSLVTVLGYGAGATLATSLIGYRDRRMGPLFTQLWLADGTEPLMEHRVGQGKINQEFLSKINCEDIQCLLGKEPEEVLDAIPESWFKHRSDVFAKQPFTWMVIDGVYVKEPLRVTLEKEYFNDVAVVIGANAQHHATMNMLRMVRWNNSNEVSSYVAERLRTINATDVWNRYNLSDTRNFFRSYTTMISEIRTICPLYFLARLLAEHFHNKVYFYVSAMPRARLRETTGAYADITAILGTYAILNSQDVKFVKNMQDSFYNFVWYGNMPTDQEMPLKFYIYDDNMQTTSKYPSCSSFQSSGIYPKYSRVD